MKKNTINYWLSEHPSVVGFQWSLTMWGSTWSFLITSIATYIISSATLHLLLLLLVGRRPIPVGRLPTLHSLAMSLVSSAIFLGTLSSAAAEIRDTRWMWQRSGTASPFEWLLCFPVGTRPSGRVFFWSYAFYMSRFLHVLRTYLVVLRRRRLSPFHLFNHSILICMSFLWLEFTQSFQVVAILAATLGFAAVNGCRFLRDVGVRRPEWFLAAANCHMVFLLSNTACHVGVLMLHLRKGGGCSGMGAWVFNSVLNSFVLFVFLRSHVRARVIRRKAAALASMDGYDELQRSKTQDSAE
ncbi:unnamed protein product [Cuscuta campestris]|uniref:Very-long-chain 3-oxoacyl-CoA synthase n=2 Tax=Cuscuta sect. Cleistogrammica TaxID=1824901 RepID=A0A484KBX8_9ASTE|nr:hypothetical protein DM860_006566 [Cuscuta australis]VFQ62378.1 unnamed protein product [Cuscuta campestris]